MTMPEGRRTWLIFAIVAITLAGAAGAVLLRATVGGQLDALPGAYALFGLAAIAAAIAMGLWWGR
jgi:hypothetical protein